MNHSIALPTRLVLLNLVVFLAPDLSTAGSLVAEGAGLEKLATGFETVEGPLYDNKGSLFFTDIPNEHIWKLNVVTLEKTLFRDNTGGAN